VQISSFEFGAKVGSFAKTLSRKNVNTSFGEMLGSGAIIIVRIQKEF
jgi:hypothetical protein